MSGFARPPWDRNQNNRVNSWTHVEEVFLVGSVMKRWFIRGSLAPNRDHSQAKDDCWASIKQHYDLEWHRYCKSSGAEKPLNRSATALKRHFKIMKSNLAAGKSLREYYLEFELRFNSEDFELRFNSEDFEQVFQKFQDVYALNTINSSEVSWVSMNEKQNLEDGISEFKRQKCTQSQTQSYYNTVAGSSGRLMAKQLQNEASLFSRKNHLLRMRSQSNLMDASMDTSFKTAESENHAFHEDFAKELGDDEVNFLNNIDFSEGLGREDSLEAAAGKEVMNHNLNTAPAELTEKGDVFSLFGIDRSTVRN